MIVIDGSSGGQALRIAIGMSALMGAAVEITDIRAHRPNPGLQAQHLASIRCVAALCDAEVAGASQGSSSVRFTPHKLIGGRFDVPIGTAGAVTLALQAALLPAAFAPKPVVLHITGGTDVSWSPPIDYAKHVLAPALAPFCTLQITLQKRGYYPAGGGIVDVKVTPHVSRAVEPAWERFAPIVTAKVPLLRHTERGRLMKINGIAHASTSLSSRKVAERMAERARLVLSRVGVPLDIATEYAATNNAGGGITLWAVFSDSGEVARATTLGASALLSPDPEGVGAQAAEELLRHIQSNCAIDPYLADQLVPWLALAGSGALRAPITDHARHAAAVVEAFLGTTFAVEKDMIKRA